MLDKLDNEEGTLYMLIQSFLLLLIGEVRMSSMSSSSSVGGLLSSSLIMPSELNDLLIRSWSPPGVHILGIFSFGQLLLPAGQKPFFFIFCPGLVSLGFQLMSNTMP